MTWTKGLRTSTHGHWNTPRAFYEKLDEEFCFDFHPCPKDPSFDGLAVPWKTSNFVNPPYGRGISAWVEKGYRESLKGKLVVFLVPARTDTRWWHDYIMRADEIRFVKGRLRFGGSSNSAPFPSAVVIFSGISLKFKFPRCLAMDAVNDPQK